MVHNSRCISAWSRAYVNQNYTDQELPFQVGEVHVKLYLLMPRVDSSHGHSIRAPSGFQAPQGRSNSALCNSMKIGHALWDHARWMGYGGEVWNTVVHCRSEWQTTSVFVPWEPHEQYEKAKWKDTERNSPGQKGLNMLLEISGEITPERMKGWSQSKNNTQWWVGLVIEARSGAILHRNLEC